MTYFAPFVTEKPSELLTADLLILPVFSLLAREDSIIPQTCPTLSANKELKLVQTRTNEVGRKVISMSYGITNLIKKSVYRYPGAEIMMLL